MIDAYEIGIQLLLQDDVSAGLAVINRELAEVDRAIAATSASLTGLVHDAERAGKAVAIAAGSRAVKEAASGSSSSAPPVDTTATTSSKEAIPPMSAVSAARSAVAPSADVIKADVSLAKDVIDRNQDTADEPRRTETPLASASNAPSKVATDEPINNNRQESPAVQGSAAVAPKPQAERVAFNATASDKLRDLNTGPQGQVERSGSTAPTSNTAMMGSVSRMVTEVAAAPSRGRSRPEHGFGQSSVRKAAAAAPWSGMEQSGSRVETRQPRERAAAPQSAGRDRAEGSGGNVMLDGRLVGQWLSEQMARDASRPPSGTSFFDARQTPAWNVSGAL